MNIALVTYYDEGKYAGEGTLEDQRLVQYLQEKGLAVKFEIWTDTQVSWEAYDAIVLKSPWDYFDRVEAFQEWLTMLEQKQVRVLNPTEVVRWNYDKRYLLDVEQAGFPIVPTQVIARNSTFNPAIYFEQWDTDTLIVKPVISGGAKNTFFLSKETAADIAAELTPLLAQEAYLVQPFMPEVQEQGEWSLIFFNGQLSHTVLKVPKNGDFRVQHYFGGAIIAQNPPAAVLESASKLVDRFAAGCLYARVDGLESQGTFRLMELELIEPMLYLRDELALYDNYYQALQQMLSV